MRRNYVVAGAALVLAAGLAACQWKGAGALPAEKAVLPPPPPITGMADGQSWAQETLDNGLKVIYAPMPKSPVSQVRVLYHVGSRDERTDRQGFAHMFEHMMFRGSAHVKPEELMQMVGLVGGFSNAYTSFDETVYHDTLPASYTEMALWLEADRMSSFMVSAPIFQTERNVVSEEWRMRLNRPYGGTFELLMPEVFKAHPYQWTPIGNMADLQAAKVQDLQDFFEKYYVPNNAILVVAGHIDLAVAGAEVKRYFGWIPGHGPRTTVDGKTQWLPLERTITPEPPQTSERRLEVKMPAPLARVMLAFRAPPEASDDIEPLEMLLNVIGGGQSSRVYTDLVTSDNPLAVDADSFMEELEDGGVMGLSATVLRGKDPAAVEKQLKAALADMRDKPVTAAELEKVKQQGRMALATRFETAEDIASNLGNEMLVRGNLKRVETARARLEAVTTADLLRVAKTYFAANQTNVMVITPGNQEGSPPGSPNPNPPAPEPADTVVKARSVDFPADYPATPPMAGTLPAATFEKGTEMTLNMGAADDKVKAAHIIVMEDHREPIVNWTVALRAGGHAVKKGKEGLAGLTADMVRRGPKGKTFDQFNEELESRAIDLTVSDGGDVTRISGRCLKEQLPFALNATREMLTSPAFDPGEYKNLQDQMLSSLRLSLTSPDTLAARELTRNIYGDSPLGRLTTIQSLSGMTLEDIKDFYGTIYKADGAIVVISGDISVPDGQAAGAKLLTGMSTGTLPRVEYVLPTEERKRTVLIDKTDAQQAAIRMGIRAYSIQSDEKFAGSLTNQIMSAGIESRLGKYVRAEKGYAYGVEGYFSPNRHAGTFLGETDTRFEVAGDAITAMYKVFDDMKGDVVPAKELGDAKFRVSGNLLMSMQTTAEQANRRLDGMLNGYPADYYDKYAERIGQVTGQQVQSVVSKYVKEDRMTVVVVGPADKLQTQLEKVGPVTVIKPEQ